MDILTKSKPPWQDDEPGPLLTELARRTKRDPRRVLAAIRHRERIDRAKCYWAIVGKAVANAA